MRVAAEVVEAKLLEDARFPEVGELAGAVSPADRDAALAGGVPAEDGAVVHEGDAGAVARRGEGGAEAGHSAADDADVHFVLQVGEAIVVAGHD